MDGGACIPDGFRVDVDGGKPYSRIAAVEVKISEL